ncbi:hypothetical protein [Stenotrophomonas sp. YAU14A_MKIMI4_1]|uniref:hypothetical protein n=1 Tax=Stenotrophomonas sp. YAU14A_MKIMI4_1 TaxID=2072408 RepID=UPI00131F0866|nr:hypothetical protein [Stenotrophomonas sp. YAU14A_MKIMI4_1]
MPIRFIPVENTAFDPESGVTISNPRILSAINRDGSEEIEYQYVFRRNGEQVGGTGFFGTKQVVEQHGRREVRYTLELSPHQVLESILRLQRALGNAEEKYSFIRNVAEGLVNVFSGQVNNFEDLRYVAVTTASALASAGVRIPDQNLVGSNVHVVLAEAYVPADAT